MTLPTDLPGLMAWFDLTAANYSGGAGGNFTNLAPGGELLWPIQGATPSFVTKGARSGMTFSNSATQNILGQMRAMRETTILVVGTTTTTSGVYPFGGTLSSPATFGMLVSNRVVYASHGSTLTPAGSAFGSDVPVVMTVTFSPENYTLYAQLNSNTPQTLTDLAQTLCVNYMNVAMGKYRNTNYTGWISRVLVYSAAYHYRDNALLQSLIATEVANL